MILRFVNSPLCLGLLLTVAAGHAVSLRAEELSPEKTRETQRWIGELDHPDYSVRSAAEKQLAAISPSAVPLIEAAVEGASTETATRLLRLLSRLYSSEDEERFSAASAAFERLSMSSNERIAEESERFLIREFRLQTQLRLAKAIRKMGGVVQLRSGETTRVSESAEELDIEFIFIGREWTGGDQGIATLMKFCGLSQLSHYPIYLTEGAKLSPEVLASLKREQFPSRISVQERGEAQLGVKPAPGLLKGPMRIDSVSPGSAAEAAGMKPDDEIVTFNGVKVDGFEHLVKLIKEKSPGDTVPVEVLRDDEEKPLKLSVKLGEWKPTPQNPPK